MPLGGSLGGNFITDWLRRKSEKEALRNNIVDKYLIQLQYSIQNLLYRLHNMKNMGGAEYMRYVKGNDEYYSISTLYILGVVLSSYRILLLFEGIYSQIEILFPGFGSKLSNKLDQFGNKLDSLQIILPSSAKPVSFFRYDRIGIG